MTRRRSIVGGFTLVEVLIALGLAAIVLGVVLQSASRDAISVARSPQRYQALLRASQVLELRMEDDRQGGDPLGSAGEKFPYDLATKPVVTDPRVEQVEVAVGSGGRQRESVSAYRLRIRRQTKSATPTPTPTPEGASPPAAAATPASGGTASQPESEP